MAEFHTSRFSHAYGGGLAGESARGAVEQNLGRIDAAILPRSSNVDGMLDQPMSAGFLGGLNPAAKAVTGQDVDLYVSNLRDPNQVSTGTASGELQHELRTRYLNKAWLERMKVNGYDGARNMMFATDNLDLWDSTATAMVRSDDWQEVKRVYVDDSFGLDLDAFFDRHNPHAQQVLLGNLLVRPRATSGAASDADLAHVATRLATSAAEHGAVCEAAICRNPALTQLVSETLTNVPGGKALAAQYRDALARATTGDAAPSTLSTAAPAAAATASAPGPTSAAPAAALPASPPIVTGRALEEVSASAVPAATRRRIGTWLSLAIVSAALSAVGWRLPA